MTVAMDKGDHMADALCFDANALTDLLRGIVTSGDTQVGRGIAVADVSGVIVAVFKAAGTAIDAGKAGANLLDLRILFYAEKVRDQGENDTCRKACGSYHDKSNQNRIHFYYLLIRIGCPRCPQIP